jgi:hypothetical protein
MKKALLLAQILLVTSILACGAQDSLTDDASGFLQSAKSELTAQNCVQLPATSVISSGSETGNPATNTFDDQLDTRWSNYGRGSFIDYDLGSVKAISGAAIAWHLGDTQINNFILYISLDGYTYTQVYSGQNSATRAAETYTFPTINARRLRITVFGNNLNDWASIAEARACAASSTPPSTPPPSGNAVWRGDFETGDLSQFSRAQMVSADRLQVVSSPVHQGRYAVKVTVKQGDNPIGASGNRNELVRLTYEPAGSEYFYRWSTMFAPDFPSPATWQLFTQWHHDGSSGSPPVEFALNNGRMILYCSGTQVWSAPLVRGAWQDFIFHAKWSSNPSVGFVELYLNGQLVLPRRYCATQFPGMLNYLKTGLYRNSTIAPTGVLYHDGWTMGRTLADVSP